MGMFGLGDDKKKSDSEFLYDLEKELSSSDTHDELNKLLEARVGIIKGILQKGEDKETYAKLGTLLHGYGALLKVMGKAQKGKRRKH